MTEQFNRDSENVVVLFYFCLTCLLTKRLSHCRQIINLIKTIHTLTYAKRGYVVMDYYLTKTSNVESLVAGLERASGHVRN